MLVLDTCVFIWLGLDPGKISKRAAAAIEAEDLAISDMTFLELGYLAKKGRIELPCPVGEFAELVLQAHGISVTAMNGSIVTVAMDLPEDVNLDPADRIISATALCAGGKLATADKNLRKTRAVPTLW